LVKIGFEERVTQLLRIYLGIKLFVILSLLGTPLIAEDRIALVIGNADYAYVSKLKNTTNDARKISDTLTGIGFQVTTLLDAPRADIVKTLADFSFRSETADLALIYYAGHGVAVEGRNFLIPVDARISRNSELTDQAIDMNDLLASVDRARKMRIVILDSCRNNPFPGGLESEPQTGARSTTPVMASPSARDLSAGMAAASPERGTLVAFSASEGAVAFDGAGGNSPFAVALADKLSKPDLEISLMFRQVRDDVMEATKNRQEPYTSGSFSGVPFYLAGSDADRAELAAPNRAEAWSRLKPDQEAQITSLAETGDARAMLGLAYMRLYPDSPSYDAEKAATWLQKAVATRSASSAEAEFELARLYENGIGLPADPARALELYQSSADQDFADAVNELGFFYFNGALGLPLDQTKALTLFRKAADLDQPEALFNVASFIDDGHVEDAGPAEAAAYLYRAIRLGSENVLVALTNQSQSFKVETRQALQKQLQDNGFYSGPIDGDFGPGTIKSLRIAFGLIE
jgi:uncharacterized protein